jgi:hypothetical protein
MPGPMTVTVRTLAQDQSVLREDGLYHVVRHSLEGFEWGYVGSGPLDLALSILVDHFKEEHGLIEFAHFHAMDYDRNHPAILRYQQFAQAFIGRLENEWVINSDQIDEWLTGLEKAKDAGPV